MWQSLMFISLAMHAICSAPWVDEQENSGWHVAEFLS